MLWSVLFFFENFKVQEKLSLRSTTLYFYNVFLNLSCKIFYTSRIHYANDYVHLYLNKTQTTTSLFQENKQNIWICPNDSCEVYRKKQLKKETFIWHLLCITRSRRQRNWFPSKVQQGNITTRHQCKPESGIADFLKQEKGRQWKYLENNRWIYRYRYLKWRNKPTTWQWQNFTGRAEQISTWLIRYFSRAVGSDFLRWVHFKICTNIFQYVADFFYYFQAVNGASLHAHRDKKYIYDTNHLDPLIPFTSKDGFISWRWSTACGLTLVPDNPKTCTKNQKVFLRWCFGAQGIRDIPYILPKISKAKKNNRVLRSFTSEEFKKHSRLKAHRDMLQPHLYGREPCKRKNAWWRNSRVSQIQRRQLLQMHQRFHTQVRYSPILSQWQVAKTSQCTESCNTPVADHATASFQGL